jgi:hypothetical protein
VTALLLHLSHSRDVADDATLIAAARQLSPVPVVAATANPQRTSRVTGMPTISATLQSVLRALPAVDSVVIFGGQPLASGARQSHVFGLRELAALAVVVRTCGKRLVLVGVGADTLRTRQDALLVRQLVAASAMTVLDGRLSADHLTAAGVPAPIRVGTDLTWLGLTEPRPMTTSGDGIWLTLSKPDLDDSGGVSTVIEEVLPAILTIAEFVGRDQRVAVQAWRSGPAAGDDLDAACEIVAGLVARGLRANAAPPAVSLGHQRDFLGRARFCIAAPRNALIAASTAGVPLLAWSHDPGVRALAQRLNIPLLTGDVATSVEHAVASAGPWVPGVRLETAAAREVIDLLKLVLTEGKELPSLLSAPRPESLSLVRPTGVLR